ncbi:MAG: hypothetical protein KAR47_08790 [Planctomycetes bacterium]|nr:hypothetical protein [Planctomycetota bacterium]
MDKRKAGLHRKVSSIFDGVPVQKGGDAAGPGENRPSQPAGSDDARLQGPGDVSGSGVGASRSDTHRATLAERLMGHGGGNVPSSQAAIARGAGKKQFKLSGKIPGVSDAKRKIMITLLPILLIVLCAALYPTLYPASDLAKTITDLAGVDSVGPGPMVAVNNTVAWTVPPVYPEELRDPMDVRTAETLAGANVNPEDIVGEGDVVVGDVGEDQEEVDVGKDIKIKSIYFSQKGKSIVVDEEILYEGDVFAGATILKINEADVEFERNGANFSRNLYP